MAFVNIAPTGGDNDQTAIQAALDAGNDVQLSAGTYRVTSGSVTINGAYYAIHIPAGRTLRGAGKDYTFIEWVGAGAGNAACVGTKDESGTTVEDLTIFTKARVVPGLGTTSGGLLVFNYSVGTGCSYTVNRVRLKNGPVQQLQLNNVDTTGGGTVAFTDCIFEAFGNPSAVGHGVDLDVTANTKVTKGVTFTGCTFNSYGQECFKAENSESITLTNCTFYTYVSLVQDPGTPYSQLGTIVFNTCTFYSFVYMNELTRRYNGGVPDNGGPGTVTFTSCTFSGDDAMLIGANNTLNKYGVITLTNTTFTGTNSHFAPPSIFVKTGVSGWKATPTLWVSQATEDKYLGAVGNLATTAGNYSAVRGIGYYRSINGLIIAVNTAVGSSTDTTGWSNFGLATSGFKIKVLPGTFNESVTCSFTNNVPFSIESAYGLGTVQINGASQTNAAFNLAGTNTQKVRISGFIVNGFTGGSSTRGFVVNNSSALVEIDGNIFMNCNCTNTGGGGRTQAATYVYIHHNKFFNCSATTNGGALQLDSSTFVENNIFDGNNAPTTGSHIRIGNASVNIVSNLFINGLGSTGVTTATASAVTINLFNNTFYNNVPTTIGSNYSDFQSTSGTAIVNLVNNLFGSTATASQWAKSSSATLNYQNNYYLASTITGTNNNDRGNNLTSGVVGFSDPGAGDFALNAASALKAAGTNALHTSIVGSLWSRVDLRGNAYRSGSMSMGAYQYV